ncbi:MAG TPA: molybdopterin-dependent oxidoreductase [Pseudomonas sp.]|nr:molybdopterin-dependent oxidoreductase [Pseudomonas sp.]
MRVVPSICTFCGVGCGIGLRVEGERVIGVEPQSLHPVSQGQLCAKGWSTSFAIDPVNRLTQPLIKERGRFRPASWDEALERVVAEFRGALDRLGPQGVGLISCARATNEDNYAAQKFARAVLKTHNVDHCARICHSPSVAGLSLTLGSGAMTNSIEDIDRADLILVIGADVTENHAMIGARMLRAQARGARLIVIDPRKTRLARLADIHLQLRLGSNIALLNGLLQVIFANGWENRDFLGRVAQEQGAQSEIDTGVAALNAGTIDATTWESLGLRCLGCSGCTSVCPTCSCFAPLDQPTGDEGQQRERVWDSCLYQGFQKEASGHNPSATPGQRVQRFWFHKFADAFKADAGRYGCVGCGRCDRVCPGGIGVHGVMQRVGRP